MMPVALALLIDIVLECAFSLVDCIPATLAFHENLMCIALDRDEMC